LEYCLAVGLDHLTEPFPGQDDLGSPAEVLGGRVEVACGLVESASQLEDADRQSRLGEVEQCIQRRQDDRIRGGPAAPPQRDTAIGGQDLKSARPLFSSRRPVVGSSGEKAASAASMRNGTAIC
jgi:hypothetical protein